MSYGPQSFSCDCYGFLSVIMGIQVYFLNWFGDLHVKQALASLHCRRRVLLSGTPMQVSRFFLPLSISDPLQTQPKFSIEAKEDYTEKISLHPVHWCSSKIRLTFLLSKTNNSSFNLSHSICRPSQNDLEEFYAMVNFTNPGILGNATAFRRYYEVRRCLLILLVWLVAQECWSCSFLRWILANLDKLLAQSPILIGREPDATDESRALSAERSAALSEIVNQVLLVVLVLVRLISIRYFWLCQTDVVSVWSSIWVRLQ